MNQLQARLQNFPAWPAAVTLWRRLAQDQLTVTASALTYTTVLALVPFFAVVLSVFTAFPLFGRFRAALERWLTESLIPASIAGNVMGYLTQFAAKASGLGALGFAALLFTTLSLVLTIDHTLNRIWRVRAPRPLAQRVLIYWGVLTLGPLVLGGSLAITSYVLTASRGWLPGMGVGVGGGMNLLLDGARFALMVMGVTLLYRYVPNAPVRWRHALAGALFVTAGLGLLRWGLGLYLSRVPGYSLIYGAFATVPILLLWLYLSWFIVLLGAVIAASLPGLLAGAARQGGGPGWDFQLAAETVRALAQARDTPAHGLTLPQLAARLRVDAPQLEPALDALRALDWVGQLDPPAGSEEPRHALLPDPARQPLRPLMEKLLLQPDPALAHWWADPRLNSMTVADLLADERDVVAD